MTIHIMKLSEPYYTLVKQKKKIIEIRINDEKRKLLKIGDNIKFTKTNGNNHFILKIKDLKTSHNFENAIKKATLKKCMPNIKTIKEAVEIYRSFPYYKDKEKYYGIILIYL